MTASKAQLFLNPTAGRGRAGKRQERILEIFAEADVAVELHNSNSVGDLEQQVQDCAAGGETRIVVAGGDGSIHEAANGILTSGRDAALGVIPTGTGNDFAKACDIPLNWEHATQLLADRIRSNSPARRIDAGRFNDRFFANGAGIGFDAKVTRIARSIRIPLGDLVYLIAVFRAMIDGVSTPDLTIDADGFEWRGPMTLASISNGAWVGGMFHIAPMADNADGRLELVMAKPMSRPRMLRVLPKLIDGQHLDSPEILHSSVTRLRARASDALPSQLDGEVQPLQTEFDIELLPQALSLL